MSDIVIKADNLGKQYTIGHQAERGRYLALRDVLMHNARQVWHKTTDLLRGKPILAGDSQEEFWALKDVSFEIRRGEAVGIIGRNGAGKSTLLKVLSRITEPSAGRVTIMGRVASLLEVGTGFHPELTGRENIYLNGAILGMTRAEIRRKFDEIVAFAEVEKFLDTPVKRFSSGMYTRLAFAVAAHLEPEILIVDEVLAVGDAQFQNKCIGKMKDVAGQGRTVLFVSHNMTAIRNLCDSAYLIDHGRVRMSGATPQVVSAYLNDRTGGTTSADLDLSIWPNRYGSGEAKIVRAKLLDGTGAPGGVLQRLQPAAIEFTIESISRDRLNFSVICMTPEGIRVLQLAHQDTPDFEPGVLTGTATIRIEIPSIPLQAGSFQWALAIHTESLSPIDVVLDALSFVVEDDLSASQRPYRSVAEHGLCSLLATWTFKSKAR